MTSEHLDQRDYEAIGGRIDALTHEMRAGFQATWAKQDVTNGRVRALEVWRGVLMGALMILAFIITTAAAWAAVAAAVLG